MGALHCDWCRFDNHFCVCDFSNSEVPKYDEYFLYENVVHAYHIDGIYPSEDEPFVWEDYIKDWGLIRWAYVKDLIPIENL